ncbi:putative hydro-lyase [Roseinatronobacter sp.]
MTDQGISSAPTLAELRAAIRSGAFSGHTAGLAPGKLQCNIAILPDAYALDFLRFCLRNPKPCPIVGVGETGDPALPTLGPDIDIRHDLPRYRLYRDGRFAEEVTDIAAHWQGDMVTVALGCSFTFERALMAAGIPMRHVAQNLTVPMYRTSLPLVRGNMFGGTMVVSMRPLRGGDVPRAVEICAQYPLAHGAPVHVGDPAAIGIPDLDAPDWGQAVRMDPDDVPVFWACGVTSQNALLSAGIPLVITHAPGHMLIADIDEGAAQPIWNP